MKKHHWDKLASSAVAVGAENLAVLVEGQLREHRDRVQELRSAIRSKVFFARTVAALVENGARQARSCSVCLDDDLPLARLAITPCAHTYCVDCLRLTVAKFHQCSICRQRLTEKECRRVALEVDVAKPAEVSAVVAELSTSISSNAPAAMETVSAGGERESRYNKYGSKLAMLVNKLLELRRADATAKVILFVQFDDLKLKVAAALKDFGIDTLQLHGSVSVRSRTIADWQNNPESSSYVLLLSLVESASGTNLTAANHVVFLHPMLAPTPELAVAQELQAIGRARRHGQTRDTVHVWRFVTRDTVEQSITERHQSELWARESAVA